MIQISINDLKREVEIMQRLSTRFVTGESERVFDALAQSIEYLKPAAAGTRRTLSILTATPIRTNDSVGQYELAPRRGSDTIFAEISGTWDVKVLGKPNRPGRLLEFDGNASTRITLQRKNPPHSTLEEVAMWRFEMGAPSSPGCHFHTQVLGTGVAPFPHSISIPRLPNYFFTPMAGLDFALGELFQSAWAEASSKASSDLALWNGIQAPRITKLLNWQIKEMKENNTSPWIVLKTAKPAADMFL